MGCTKIKTGSLVLTIYRNERKTHLPQGTSFCDITRQPSMAEIRHLKNAPITEAIIDFRVKNSNVQSLEKSTDYLKERIFDSYPKAQAMLGYQAEVRFRLGGVTEQTAGDTGFKGYFFTSEDGLNVAQFRADGFTFNRLKPYTSWENIFTEVMRLWGLYIEVAKPEYVIRIAVRYINHIKIPLPVEDISRYLTTLPDSPKNTFYQLRGFLTRLQFVELKLNLEAITTQALELSPDPNSVILYLDIDAYKQGQFSPLDEDIPKILKALREMKNTIFFGSITEETVRLFNGS